MSFLNSVLSSIGGNGAQSPTPSPQPNRPPKAEIVQASSRPLAGAPTVATVALQNNKRKAEDDLERPNGKTKKNGIAGGQSVPGVQSSRTTQTVDTRLPRPKNTPIAPSSSSSKGPIPYRGTSKPNAASAAPPTPPTPVGEPAKAPKKGSYAEIMARAKAGQDKSPAVGVISHKPKDKIAISYKKELKLKKKALKDKKLGIKEESRPGSSSSMSSSPAPGSSDSRRVPQPAYKGTAKPKPQPTYKGTMNPASSSTQKQKPRDQIGHGPRNRYDEYAATDEDDLDDVEEDDYGSEESDDMEAGFTDVEKEETVAAKAARREDEEEARLEAKLKNEKEERKKRLEAMAKKAKPQRY